MKLTPENAKAAIPLLQAVADGKVIQNRNLEGGWIDLKVGERFVFSCEPIDYRIKPEPRVIYVNEYPGGDGLGYVTEEKARRHHSGATRVAVRYVEDTTNGK